MKMMKIILKLFKNMNINNILIVMENYKVYYLYILIKVDNYNK